MASFSLICGLLRVGSVFFLPAGGDARVSDLLHLDFSPSAHSLTRLDVSLLAPGFVQLGSSSLLRQGLVLGKVAVRETTKFATFRIL
eukprot:s2617_g1.t1